MNQIVDKAFGATKTELYDQDCNERGNDGKRAYKRESFRIFSGNVWEHQEFLTALNLDFSSGCNKFFENSEASDNIDYYE